MLDEFEVDVVSSDRLQASKPSQLLSEVINPLLLLLPLLGRVRGLGGLVPRCVQFIADATAVETYRGLGQRRRRRRRRRKRLLQAIWPCICEDR